MYNNPNMPAEQAPTPITPQPIQENSLFKWTAPSRPFKRRSRDFYIKVISIAALFGLIIFLIEGLMPILLLISLIFLFYVMSTIEPDNLEYELTNLGIKIASKRTGWETMNRFWFINRLGSELLIIETASLPGRLEIMIKPETKPDILKIVSNYLPHEKMPPSFLDKTVTWTSKFLPE
jgi:hypothetical protein